MPEGKVKVPRSRQDWLSLSASSVLQIKCCKRQKSAPRPPPPHVGHAWAWALLPHTFFLPPRSAPAPKIADSGKFQRQGAVHVAAGQEDRAGQAVGRSPLCACEPHPPSLSHLETLAPLPPSGQELSHMSAHRRILSSSKDHRLSCFIRQQPDCLG